MQEVDTHKRPWHSQIFWLNFADTFDQIPNHCLLLICVILFTNPSARAGYDTRSIFKRSLTGMNSEFSFSEPSLSYLPIAGGRIIGLIPFPRVLVQCEMQSFSSRIWTFIKLSMCYQDWHSYFVGKAQLIPFIEVVTRKHTTAYWLGRKGIFLCQYKS